ncbi:FliH/SctL family protein [Tepidiforma flava]|uniref:FliH/SctL family protein n=1 Tax=Tepidiforma flava TaxID=3004094 RepID=A0ABY7M816_9CHLR|nr:FliH/SctL family protein [Tepidiforma flava]WBL36680.1 FliH/SctL family protein [Tepidiforma flava]
MNWSARPPRVIRSARARAESDVFVIGASSPAVPVDAPVATAAEVIAAAEARAAEIIAAAEAEAARIRGSSSAEAAAAAAAAAEQGYRDGLARAEAEARDLLELLRAAAREGRAIRDQVAASASGLLAEAVVLAVRRIVGLAYQADPALTAAACEEAVRAAAGQELLSIRVNPAVEAGVTAALGDLGAYVRPDAAIGVGGCIVDLRSGTIDATLDARLDLAELAIRRAAGGEP